MRMLDPSLGLLAPKSLLPTLQEGLAQAGFELSFSFDPSVEEDRPLPLATVILVILTPQMEPALEGLEERLYAEGQETLFDECEDRQGWDAARWATHLAPKLAPLLSPAREAAPSAPEEGLGIDAKEGAPSPAPSPSVSQIPQDWADDFVAEEDSPLFMQEAHEPSDDASQAPPDMADALSMEGEGFDLAPTQAPAPQAPAVPSGWALEAPSPDEEAPLQAPAPAKPQFDTGGLSFAGEEDPSPPPGAAQDQGASPTASQEASHAREGVAQWDAPGKEAPQEQGMEEFSWGQEEAPSPQGAVSTSSDSSVQASASGFALIVGGTGGPAPLREILTHLSDRIPVPVVIHQYLPQGRYDALAANLGKHASIPVQAAEEGTVLAPGCAWILEDGLIPELSQQQQWVAVKGDIALAISRVGDTEGALLAVSGAGQEIVFPAMEALAAGALLIGQDPDQAYESDAIETLVDLGMVVGAPAELGAHLMEHWGTPAFPVRD